MNPDQPLVPQPTPTPEEPDQAPAVVPPAVPPTAVLSPEPIVVPPQTQIPDQPMVVAQPEPQPPVVELPVASTSPFGNPIGPISSAGPTAASIPQPGMPMAIPMPKPQPPKKSKKKLFIILGAVIAGLAVLGVGAWFLIMYIIDHTIALKTYDGATYSILVPTDYTVDTSDPTNLIFKNPKSKDLKTPSEEGVAIQDFPSGQRNKVIAAADKEYTKETIAAIAPSINYTIDNISVTKIKQSGQEARRIHADFKSGGKKAETIDLEIVFGTNKTYFINVDAYITDQAFSNSAGKIIDSFTLK
jgi:hypothetical protein